MRKLFQKMAALALAAAVIGGSIAPSQAQAGKAKYLLKSEKTYDVVNGNLELAEQTKYTYDKKGNITNRETIYGNNPESKFKNIWKNYYNKYNGVTKTLYYYDGKLSEKTIYKFNKKKITSITGYNAKGKKTYCTKLTYKNGLNKKTVHKNYLDKKSNYTITYKYDKKKRLVKETAKGKNFKTTTKNYHSGKKLTRSVTVTDNKSTNEHFKQVIEYKNGEVYLQTYTSGEFKNVYEHYTSGKLKGFQKSYKGYDQNGTHLISQTECEYELDANGNQSAKLTYDVDVTTNAKTLVEKVEYVYE